MHSLSQLDVRFPSIDAARAWRPPHVLIYAPRHPHRQLGLRAKPFALPPLASSLLPAWRERRRHVVVRQIHCSRAMRPPRGPLSRHGRSAHARDVPGRGSVWSSLRCWLGRYPAWETISWLHRGSASSSRHCARDTTHNTTLLCSRAMAKSQNISAKSTPCRMSSPQYWAANLSSTASRRYCFPFRMGCSQISMGGSGS